MENEKQPFGTGAHESQYDPRTAQHGDMGAPLGGLMQGGIVYAPGEILHQHNVGICTAISFIQNRNRANKKRYSADFQYLLQKKFIDQAWFEGSSIFSALKVGYIYGLLPESEWTHTTEDDRKLPYSQYIAKLQAVSTEEILRLLKLCVDKIPGYAQVDVEDPQAIAKAVIDSDVGILCRYGCQKNWWTPSWNPKDIDPLRWAPETSGHAIGLTYFDYTKGTIQLLANTWGTLWDLQGNAHINWDNYKMNEAWIILKEKPPIVYPTIRKGMSGEAVKVVQKILGVNQTGYFGIVTDGKVRQFQTAHGLKADGVVGPLTWAKLLAK